MHEKIKAATSSSGQEEKKEYICMRCRSEYTAIEVLDSLDPAGRGTGFLCKRCSNPLSELGDDIIQQDDTTALFNKQFAPILSILQKIDDTVVPEVTGEQALADMRPMPRTELNPAPKTQAAPTQASRPTAVKGMSTAPEKIEVAITSDLESTAAQQAANAERKAKIAAQNQMPEWHERSTISGDAFKRTSAAAGGSVGGAATSAAPTANGEDKPEEKKDDSASLANFYEMLEKERQEQERLKQEEEEEEEEDDDDEDDFEDVGGVGSADAGTPNVGGDKRAGQLNGDVPVVKVDAPDADETTPAPTPANKVAPSTSSQMDTPRESDEDEDEFEDVPAAVIPPPASSTEGFASAKRPIERTNGETPDAKRVKLEEGAVKPSVAGDESDEDEGDFEDVV
ncbi:MAG: hypothetical protein INR71_01960 [Terriglobus roseus]|nr:hypothetical protein [Terriglobus roseus]